MRKSFYLKVVLVVFFWFVWALTADQISKIKPLKSFDPYQILGVDPGAEMKDIKKAYRRLSLIKHPDKNPDDPLAVTEFIQITKAYTVSLNILLTIWLDFDWWNCEIKLGKVWQPWRPRQFPGCYRAPSLPARERLPRERFNRILCGSFGRDPWLLLLVSKRYN